MTHDADEPIEERLERLADIVWEACGDCFVPGGYISPLDAKSWRPSDAKLARAALHELIGLVLAGHADRFDLGNLDTATNLIRLALAIERGKARRRKLAQRFADADYRRRALTAYLPHLDGITHGIILDDLEAEIEQGLPASDRVERASIALQMGGQAACAGIVRLVLLGHLDGAILNDVLRVAQPATRARISGLWTSGLLASTADLDVALALASLEVAASFYRKGDAGKRLRGSGFLSRLRSPNSVVAIARGVLHRGWHLPLPLLERMLKFAVKRELPEQSLAELRVVLATIAGRDGHNSWAERTLHASVKLDRTRSWDDDVARLAAAAPHLLPALRQRIEAVDSGPRRLFRIVVSRKPEGWLLLDADRQRIVSEDDEELYSLLRLDAGASKAALKRKLRDLPLADCASGRIVPSRPGLTRGTCTCVVVLDPATGKGIGETSIGGMGGDTYEWTARGASAHALCEAELDGLMEVREEEATWHMVITPERSP